MPANLTSAQALVVSGKELFIADTDQDELRVLALSPDGGGRTFEPAPNPIYVLAVPVATRPVAWVENAWTQPVPSWGSPVRLNLPVPLSSIVLGSAGGLGAFGAHEGAHAEGLNHVWIPTVTGTVVRSWAAGTVTKIEDMGSRGRAPIFSNRSSSDAPDQNRSSNCSA